MVKKIFSYLILPIIIIGLVYLIVESIMEPIRFNEQKEAREAVAIQRLKDIRDLQVAFKSETGHFTPSIDSLKDFYNNGTLKVVMQIGSNDDSLAVVNTQKLKRRNPRITPQQMLQLYVKGEHLVFSIENEIPVKDTLFNGRPDFCIDSLAFIPFCGDSIIMESAVKRVSGVNVPLFEASMPYKQLLQGLDNQLRINLDAEREDTGRYPGLKVGSVTAPNNNAGNWE
ncbi:MAG: hypothetical protein IAB91_07745 [Bacteroidetes bacterium]|uniref:Uncharacterized protein n=1 Tax=Candidatus Cryptobacteroides faecigallinarum TaxID=2840763 RepID=A0A9D9IMV3_9BACT|nr:hypothetical protein [Candidatus Cryptobacteroides faecigallinarum]